MPPNMFNVFTVVGVLSAIFEIPILPKPSPRPSTTKINIAKPSHIPLSLNGSALSTIFGNIYLSSPALPSHDLYDFASPFIIHNAYINTNINIIKLAISFRTTSHVKNPTRNMTEIIITGK